MKRETQRSTVTVKNPNVFSFGEELEVEGDYVSVAVSTVKETSATSDKMSPSFTRSFLPVAVSWVILVAIMALRIYYGQCEHCQNGWLLSQSSCYAINNAENAQKTWEEARENCKGKISDLAVIDDKDAKKFINDNSYGGKGSSYWIGLRVEDGRWKWINGSDLTETSL
ncbi:hypothetical protein PAMP_002568 [Pampus punctatissimus]